MEDNDLYRVALSSESDDGIVAAFVHGNLREVISLSYSSSFLNHFVYYLVLNVVTHLYISSIGHHVFIECLPHQGHLSFVSSLFECF